MATGILYQAIKGEIGELFAEYLEFTKKYTFLNSYLQGLVGIPASQLAPLEQYFDSHTEYTIDFRTMPHLSKTSQEVIDYASEVLFELARDEGGQKYARSAVEDFEHFLERVNDLANDLDIITAHSRDEFFDEEVFDRANLDDIEESIKEFLMSKMKNTEDTVLWRVFAPQYKLDRAHNINLQSKLADHVRQTAQTMIGRLSS